MTANIHASFSPPLVLSEARIIIIGSSQIKPIKARTERTLSPAPIILYSFKVLFYVFLIHSSLDLFTEKDLLALLMLLVSCLSLFLVGIMVYKLFILWRRGLSGITEVIFCHCADPYYLSNRPYAFPRKEG
jgi:hypothetical protein